MGGGSGLHSDEDSMSVLLLCTATMLVSCVMQQSFDRPASILYYMMDEWVRERKGYISFI